MALFTDVLCSTFTQGKCVNMSVLFHLIIHEIAVKEVQKALVAGLGSQRQYVALHRLEGDERFGRGKENNLWNYPGKLNMI